MVACAIAKPCPRVMTLKLFVSTWEGKSVHHEGHVVEVAAGAAGLSETPAQYLPGCWLIDPLGPQGLTSTRAMIRRTAQKKMWSINLVYAESREHNQ